MVRSPGSSFGIAGTMATSIAIVALVAGNPVLEQKGDVGSSLDGDAVEWLLAPTYIWRSRLTASFR
jgi:hypothetical protein